jgi:aquaporin Z
MGALMETKKGVILFAEMIGTFVLVLGGCGTAVLAGTHVGYLGVSIAFGLTLLVMAYAIGGISGCHINPAVTLGLVIAKKCKTEDAPYYVFGQLIGAVIAGAVIFGIAVSQTGATASTVRNGGFASNGFGTHSPDLYKLIGVAVGLTLTLIHLISIPVDNTSVNPARSIGVAVFQGGWALKQLWVFIVFPLVGGALGALVWRLLAGEDEVIAEAGDAVRYE